MGEIVELILEGVLCQVCGELINMRPIGYPVTCSICSGEEIDPEYE